MRRKVSSQGIALVMIVGILMVIATMAVMFARSAYIEQNIAVNYSDKLQARLTCFAGIEMAICRLSEYMNQYSYMAAHNQPWRYPYGDNVEVSLENACKKDSSSDSIAGVSYQMASAPYNPIYYPYYYPSGILGDSASVSIANLYSLKILDLQGQVNVNSHIVVPYNSTHQSYSDAVLQRMIKNLAVFCGFSDTQATQIAGGIIRGENLAGTGTAGGVWYTAYSAQWPATTSGILPKRWNTKEAIKLYLVNNLGLSWDDAKTLKFWNNLCVSSWVDRSTSMVKDHASSKPLSVTHLIPQYVWEMRSPININTATKEVLYSILMVKAQPYYLNNSSSGRKYEDSSLNSEIKQDRDISSLPARWTISLESTNPITSKTYAQGIADRIIQQRQNFGPFRSWGDFVNFVDTYLDASYFPTNSWASNYHPNTNPSDPPPDATLGERIWLKACRDLVKSNFSPNMIDNHFNPTQHTRFRTVKSDFFDGTTRTHSTEFCFSSMGNFEISSFGYTVNKINNQMICSVLLKTDVSLYAIVRHTTQQDFEATVQSYNPTFSYTTTYPAVLGKGILMDVDVHTGRVEPQITFNSPFGTSPLINTFSSRFAPVRSSGTQPEILSSTSERFLSLYGGQAANYEMKLSQIRSDSNNLANDGIFSERRQYELLDQTRYYSIGALISNDKREGARRGMNFPTQTYKGDSTVLPRTSKNTNDRLPYYKGALEFWVKLSEPSNAQIACGLFGATQVNLHKSPDPDRYPSQTDDFAWEYQIPTSLQEASEGIQFYIFKNTFGQLHFSRLYFASCYDAAGNLKGTHYRQDADGWQYQQGEWPVFNRWKANQQNQGYYFPVPRRDVVIKSDLVGWDAGTWHHVFMAWDDGNASQRIFLDGTEISNASMIAQHFEDTPDRTDPEFCILNERNPLDSMNICGFYRYQKETNDGVFKLPDQRLHIPGNATISNFRAYTLSDSSANPLPDINRPSRRIFEASSTYTHRMLVSQGGKLGTISWTAYPDRVTSPNLQVTVSYTDIQGIFRTVTGNLGQGLSLGHNVNANSLVTYVVTFSSGERECAALDDITLTINNVKMGNFVESYYAE